MSKKVICASEECTGCCACYNICPKNCITMEENELGHIIPIIDEDTCINCNLCSNMCPVNKKVEARISKDAYVVWNLDESDRVNSASGGAASVFSRYFIENNGVVFGCKIDEDLNILHGCAERVSEIEIFKGSKYVQSYIGNAYKEAKKKLEANINVIFFGTPCQIAGLNNYLSKEYKNLTTIDIVCHGVPPKKYLKEHIENINKNNKKKITNVTFRGKYNFLFTAYSNDYIIYQNSNWEDIYFRGFTYGLYHRDCCYKCKYSNPKRVSDLTIGDFHGLGKKVKFDNKGVEKVSLLMINTPKGEKLFEECKGMLFYEKRTVEEAVAGNAQLKRPSRRHENVDKFRKLYLKYGFEKSAKKCLSKEINLVIYNKAKGKIKSKVKSIIKSLIK